MMAGLSADLTHVESWLFDLDETLYPADCGFMTLMRERITRFVMRLTGLDAPAAQAVQRGWFETHGAALPGLLAEHDVEPRAFLDEIHDVPLDVIRPDPVLDAALARLPGRKLVFTNGSASHAERVLARLGVAGHFEDVFHIETAGLIPKPAPQTFARMMAAFGLEAGATAYFEDSERNLEPAAGAGMTTVLVGPHAAASAAPFVHHRTEQLAPFLLGARVRETAP